LATVEENAGENRELRQFVATSRIDLFSRRGQWEDAEAHFKQAADGLDDGALRRAFMVLEDAARRAQQPDLADRLCVFVLEQQKGKGVSVLAAARRWVANATGRGTPEACRRLKAVVEDHLAPGDSLPLYASSFYKLAEACEREDQEALLALGEALHERLQSEQQKDQMLTLLFDGAFMIGDYDRAMPLLEAGLPHRDEDWHAMARNKLRAHMALDEGNVDEAVERFRVFMDYVSDFWEQPERDPSTGIQHTREMALGFNARRIGDILSKAGKADAADDAYAEARAHYLEAERKLKAGSKELALVKEALASLPATAEGESPADK
jgi:tetratricopeptide (TPR) repeat protein